VHFAVNFAVNLLPIADLVAAVSVDAATKNASNANVLCNFSAQNIVNELADNFSVWFRLLLEIRRATIYSQS
jgi:hypothetical protein